MKLGEMASVRSGLVLGRKQAREEVIRRYPLLNLKCIHPSGFVDTSLCETFDAAESLNPEYLTHSGDVVIRLTAPYTAVLITDGLEGYVIPSSFVVARAKKSILLPEYLVWLINSQPVKRQISESAMGTVLGTIKPRFFADFEVDEIPLPHQRTLAELNRLARQEIHLLTELASEKEKYNDFMMNQVFTDMKRGNQNDNTCRY